MQNVLLFVLRFFEGWFYNLSRRGVLIMIVKKKIDINKALSKEQRQMIEALEQRKIEEDRDNPELTLEELREFKRVSEENRENRKKQTVTIRLSPQTLEKAKSLGKGYTSVLARILENGLNDADIIRKCL